jgi:hypothetical protein
MKLPVEFAPSIGVRLGRYGFDSENSRDQQTPAGIAVARAPQAGRPLLLTFRGGLALGKVSAFVNFRRTWIFQQERGFSRNDEPGQNLQPAQISPTQSPFGHRESPASRCADSEESRDPARQFEVSGIGRIERRTPGTAAMGTP